MKAIVSATAVLFFVLTGLAVAQDGPAAPPLPQPRPDDLGVDADEETPAPPADEEMTEDRVYQTACPALLTGRISGQMLAPMSEGQCGLQNPIALSAVRVNGREISLAGTPVTECATATALADWVSEIDSYARAVLGAGVQTLGTGTGYQCRLRYGADSGFLSEHGRGTALDIASISLENGAEITVLDDWQRLPVSEQAKFLAFAHGAACARFTTVLGPEANADHEDHFHFDLGCHGQSCTAVICE